MGKKGEKNTSTEIKTTKAQAIKDSKKDIDDLFSSFEKEKKKEITQQKKEKKEKSKAVPKNSNKEGKPASTPKSKKKRKIEDRDNDEDDDFFDNRGESKSFFRIYHFFLIILTLKNK